MTDLSRTVTVDVAVRGRDNYKYFRRPVNQQPGDGTPEVKYETETQNKSPNNEESKPVPKTRTIGTQSLYRESEAQTVPYSPDYVLKDDGQIPEVLHLQKLGLECGQGLPAGRHEVELIERARQRRAYEAALPPLSGDPSMTRERMRMMEDQELLEQQYRHDALKQVHQEKLEHISTRLRSRDEEREKEREARVDAMVDRRHELKEQAVDKLQQEHVKELRKLAQNHKNVERKKEKRNIIEDYANFASKVYTTPVREGTLKTGLGSTMGNTTSALGDYATLENMDMRVTRNISTATTKHELMDKRKPRPRRSEVQLATQLANVDAAIVRSKNPKPGPLPPPAVAQRIERPPPRPPTPSVSDPNTTDLSSSPSPSISSPSSPQTFTRSRPPQRPSSVDPSSFSPSLSPNTKKVLREGVMGGEDEADFVDAQTRAIILLQRLLRGRAMQNAMFEGKERRRELIQELRTEISEETIESDNKWIEERKAKEEKDRRDYAIAAGVVGMEVGTALDFLAKELVRTRQLAQISQMVRNAEIVRAQREDAEGADRRAREAMRKRVDWEYSEIQKVHKKTVKTFLDEVYQEAVAHAASVHAQQAIAGIQEQKEKERIAQRERMRAELGSEFDEEEWEISHFVSSFLLPAVEKELSNQDVHIHANKHTMAVKDCLADALLAL